MQVHFSCRLVRLTVLALAIPLCSLAAIHLTRATALGAAEAYAPTGISALDAMMRAEIAEAGQDPDAPCPEPELFTDVAQCDDRSAARVVRIESLPVSSRMITLIKHAYEPGNSGRTYHTHERRFIWGVRENRMLTFTDLVQDPQCLSARPPDTQPELQAAYDRMRQFNPAAKAADLFTPTPDGFELWIGYDPANGPAAERFPLAALEPCGVRQEYWAR